MPEESQVDGPLDYEISIEELEAVSKKTKKGKAVSLDNICNEMLIALVSTYPKLLLKLFNMILQSGEVLIDWTNPFFNVHQWAYTPSMSNSTEIYFTSSLVYQY